MVKCTWCDQEMKDNNTIDCTANRIVKFPDGTELPAVSYNLGWGQRCHDCNVQRGGYHHPGCDMERCPKCGGQLISCGCLEEEEL